MGMSRMQVALFNECYHSCPSLGKDSRLYPAYLAIILLITHICLFVVGVFRNPSRSSSYASSAYIRTGKAYFVFRVLSFLGAIALAALAIFFVIWPSHASSLTQTGFIGEVRAFNQGAYISPHEAHVQVVELALYAYVSILALLAAMPPRRWTEWAYTHFSVIMLTDAVVYSYRDLWPIATYSLKPMDAWQGWALWFRVTDILFIGAFLPLITPRLYRPVDPSNPSENVNQEQTASWLSFLTYAFLDPLIWKAAKLPHLPYDSLPSLADYDKAEHIVKDSKEALDPFLQTKKRHLFWNLMRYFSSVYVQLAVMITIRCLTAFIPPVAMNKLLSYLEKGNEGQDVRPWVWVILLFIGPNAGSIALQYYIFLTTRMMVRTEGIITQLVFEHALRIRMKAETQRADLSVSHSPKSKTPSITEASADNNSLHDSATNSGDETLRESSSVASSVHTTKRKSKKLPPSVPERKEKETKKDNLVGKINNLVTTDLGNLIDGRDFLFLILYSPLQFCVSVWLLYSLLGWSALVGVSLSAGALPLPGYIAKVMNRIQTERMKKTDARVQTVTEILSVLRMVKLFGWEPNVNKLINDKRDEELFLLRKRKIVNMINIMLNYVFPLMTMLATFACYTLIQKKGLTAATVFSSIAVFEQLRESLRRAFFFLPMLIDAKVSLNRVDDFLRNTELLDCFATTESPERRMQDPGNGLDSSVIGFRNATFTWSNVEGEDSSKDRRFQLNVDGELLFKPGKLSLIIGPTGSGKTSLFMGLLGEMHFIPMDEHGAFSLPREGGVAYAAQEAWVQNETIRDNILFGNPYDEARYRKVLYQCGLEPDLRLFESGDGTEVGEKGLTLSGGQKARVTLARAVYSDAAIVLLDDILAALDVHTSKFVVDNCLQGDLLKGRTVILITHNIALVGPIADFVVSLTMDGHIASRGTLGEALKKNKNLIAEEVESQQIIAKAQEEITFVPERLPHKGSKLIVAEEIALGHVSWRAMKLYLLSLGGPSFWLIFLGSMFISQLGNSAQSWFLGHWALQYNNKPAWAVPVSFYLIVYAVILLSIAAFWCLGMGAFVYGSIKASRQVHKELIRNILGTTLRWLDTVPTARIIARCTQDIRAVDGPIADELSDTVDLTFYLLIRFVAILLFVPTFLLPGLLVFILGGTCGQLYMKAQLSVKREMSNRRSPVLAHFGAAVAGLVSVRAYGAQAAFKSESLKRINGYIRPARTFYNCNRWVCIRIDAIGSGFSACLAAYMLYDRSTRTASDTGFALSTAITLSQAILWWIRILNELEVQGNSLERIESYTNIDQEPKPSETGKAPAYWPSSGSLKVENLCARYSTDGPEVLHNISFAIESGERVGVVGRTGSGKSSLTLSLLRCIPTEGDIIYDGIPIQTLNLDVLRSCITIIPQHPELLSGTLRENLDPFSEHTDATLNEALRSAGLFTLQEEHDEARISLDSMISGGGSNLSVGQRQILALARAILRKSKLIILDEATSAIDYATDAIIQNSLKETLKDATLITVAHRLQTIMDADKIMVLDSGNMVEFDTPEYLLKKKGGYFKSLVDQSGDRERLYAMAIKTSK